MGVGAAVVGLAWYARHRALRAGCRPRRRARPVHRPTAAPRGLTPIGGAPPLPAAPVVHPADVLTVVLAWLAVLAVCVGRGAVRPDRPHRAARTTAPSRARRIGLFLSLSGPWLAVLAGAGAGLLSGAWLLAAAGAAVGVVVTAAVGFILAPH